MTNNADIIIIGGGPVGATLALALRDCGQSVTLLEARAAGDNAVNAIRQHCEKSLAKFKVPRAINVVPELPKIGNNKVHRPALREMAKAGTTGG